MDYDNCNDYSYSFCKKLSQILEIIGPFSKIRLIKFHNAASDQLQYKFTSQILLAIAIYVKLLHRNFHIIRYIQ